MQPKTQGPFPLKLPAGGLSSREENRSAFSILLPPATEASPPVTEAASHVTEATFWMNAAEKWRFPSFTQPQLLGWRLYCGCGSVENNGALIALAAAYKTGFLVRLAS